MRMERLDFTEIRQAVPSKEGLNFALQAGIRFI